MTNMEKTITFGFLLLTTISLSLSKAKGDLNFMQSTCNKTPNPSLCLSVLKSNPKSNSTDLPGLGVIIVEAAKAKATTALNTINNLKRTKPSLRESLNKCSQSYNIILEYFLPEAVEALTKGNPKFAEDGLNNFAAESQSCENNLKPNSPITSLNVAVHELSLIGLAIAKMLL